VKSNKKGILSEGKNKEGKNIMMKIRKKEIERKIKKHKEGNKKDEEGK